MNDRPITVRYNDAAGPLQRPFAITDGRTDPSIHLNLLSLLRAADRVPASLDPIRQRIVAMCSQPTGIAEIAGRLAEPIVVAKILVSDLIEQDAVVLVDRFGLPSVEQSPADADPDFLERVLSGLRTIPV
jgi:hypothetical protein